MNLKKIIPDLVTGIEEAGFNKNPREIQTASIPQIKSGADLFLIAPEGAGKSTSLVIGVIQQLKAAFEDAPRAIVITSTKEKAYELEAQFEVLGRYTDLRTFVVFDKGVLQYQKDVIFEGLDVVIGTPKRINELIRANGIPFSKMKMIVIDEADSFKVVDYGMIYGVVDSSPKSQFILVGNTWDKKFDNLSDRIMKNPRIVKG
jgi:superfamily II DNA/RNA helicase